jgi:hypothetical protein
MTSNSNRDALTPQEIADLKRLIAIGRDGVLQEPEHSRLEQLLSASREARAMYIGYMQLDAGLDWKVRGSQSLDGLLRLADGGKVGMVDSPAEEDKPIPKRKGRRLIFACAALAACLIFVVTSLTWVSSLLSDRNRIADVERKDAAIEMDNALVHGEPGTIANVINITDDCHWFVESRRSVEGSILAGDTIRLTKGKLRVDFACGAVVTMKSPAALQVIAPKHVRAILGTLTAHAGEGAEGFTIDTPRTKVVDLGTDFGIDVTDHGSTDVVVFNGAVDLHSEGVRGLSARQRLGAGEGIRVTGDGTASRIVSILDSKFSIADRSTSLRQVPVVSEVRDNIRRGESWHYYEIVHGGMREDAKAFADREHEWNGIDKAGMPSYLAGGDYVKTFNDDKLNRNVEIEVTIDRPAALYVLYDNRSPVPDWLRDDFIDTGDEIGIDGTKFQRFMVNATLGTGPGVSIDDTLSIWRRDVPVAGKVKLGAIEIGGERHNMYGIVAVPLQIDDGPDDFAGTADHPSSTAAAVDPSRDGRMSVNGAIERQGDVDTFSFDWRGGVVQVACHVSGYSTLDPILTICDASETLVGYASASRSQREDAEVTMNLPAGVYFASVSGGDELGEVGYYHLAIAPTTANVEPPIVPPPSLVLNADARHEGIGLTWNELPGVVSYRVERSRDGISYTLVDTAESASLMDPLVAPATTYIYRVQAVLNSELLTSAPAKVRTLPPVVSQVQSFGFGPNSISISWRDVKGERGYRIERSVDGKQFETVASAEMNANGFRDTTIAPGSRYFYRVAALGHLKDGPASTPAPALQGVNDLSVSGVIGAYTIRWSADYPHEPLAVQRAVGGGEFTTIATLDSGAGKFIDKRAPSANELKYRVLTLREGSGLTELRSEPIDRIRIPDNVDEDYFALCFNGKFKTKNAGRYKFHLDSDDGSRLLVDGIVVVDNDGRHSNKRVTGDIHLDAGQHDIELQYFEFFGFTGLRLKWGGPGVKTADMPPAAFSSLRYRYYQGIFPNLPFHQPIAKSEVVSAAPLKKSSPE